MSKLSYHDRIFKKFLSDITVARDFLSTHLPEKLRQLCDFSTLRMEPGSFIESNLRSRYSDMLYSLQTTSGRGYILCLIEHQSRPEKMMAFKMLRYSIAAMQQHLDQGNKELPVVIPLLFYAGKISPWPYSTHWLDCFCEPDLAKSVYMQAFPLADITVIPDEEILTHKHVALLELVHKHIHTRDMLELADQIAGLLNRWPPQLELFRGLIHYIIERGNTSDEERFFRQIEKTAPDYREEIVTIAEQLRQKGEKKGMLIGKQEGMLIGKQEGKKEAAIEFAQRLIADGVAHDTVKMYTGLSDAEIDTLRQQ